MKHIKTYEEVNINEPEVGDYAIIKNDSIYFNTTPWKSENDINYLNFIKSSIGYIFKKPNKTSYLIKFENIPDIYNKYFQFSDYSDGLKFGNSILVYDDDIEYWSKNKEELEHILAANKYNL